MICVRGPDPAPPSLKALRGRREPRVGSPGPASASSRLSPEELRCAPWMCLIAPRAREHPPALPSILSLPSTPFHQGFNGDTRIYPTEGIPRGNSSALPSPHTLWEPDPADTQHSPALGAGAPTAQGLPQEPAPGARAATDKNKLLSSKPQAAFPAWAKPLASIATKHIIIHT